MQILFYAMYVLVVALITIVASWPWWVGVLIALTPLVVWIVVVGVLMALMAVALARA